MNAVPAKVAGVPRIVMVVPTPDGELNPLVLAAARLAGVDEVYRVGGAQAVAALAYGRQTIAPVAKIVGPGNAYVAAAKRRVFGQVGIDMIAGPSEVLVIADGARQSRLDRRRPAGPGRARRRGAIDPDHRQRRPRAMRWRRRSSASSRRCRAREIAARELARFRRDHPRAPTSTTAVPLVDRLAPEHLEIETADAEALAAKIRNAGAIFLGSHTPEAIGDYVGGPNHVLPTARSARFSSGPRRARLHEADLDPEMRRRRLCARSARPPIALGRGGGAGGACALGRDPPEPVTRAGAWPGDGERHRGTARQAALVAVTLDEVSIGRGKPDQEHERAVAIYDLVEENHSRLPGHDGGPYALHSRSSRAARARHHDAPTARR